MDREERRLSGVGRIYLRGERYWIAYYRNGREIRKSAHTTSEAVARKVLTAEIRKITIGRDDRLSFKELIGFIRDDYELRGLKSAYDLEHSRIPHLRRAFGHLRASDLTAARLQRYAADRKRAGAANATINRELNVLKRAMKLAAQHGQLGSIPFVPSLPETTVRQGFVSHAQFRAISAAVTSDVFRDIAEFLYLTGWRVSEALGLEWRDVDSDSITLRIENSKTGYGRRIPLAGHLAGLIDRRIALRLASCRFVFHQKGRRPVRHSVARAWRRAAAAALCPGILIHDLRRTAARNLVRAGVPERVVMTMLGHRTRSMLDRYNITSDADLVTARERLDVYLNAQSTERNVRLLSVPTAGTGSK